MIGKNITLLRKEKDLTLSELAERANVAKSYLSNIERNINQNPSIQIVEKIARVLDVEVKTLINGEIAETETLHTEWIDLIEEIKKSGLKKEDIQEYKTLIEFIKWKNNQEEEMNMSCHEGKNE
ncbi:helix-turn-helix transcriptional regulator [Bacillus sp. V3B]|uniref:helix-turn-helix domain-containing protein n=1 Tax=Bacillus sp. V3B TaxID=2804915 RepID=UPI00210BC442|nr:helix-turn-helix transcriptional regulator [Bacillus sp. V3B]MCQ6275287.1 helix-turn-helix transcriptional regulator [Bacillus sp. V3B]